MTEIVTGDIIRVQCYAIVSPANSRGTICCIHGMGTGGGLQHSSGNYDNS